MEAWCGNFKSSVYPASSVEGTMSMPLDVTPGSKYHTDAVVNYCGRFRSDASVLLRMDICIPQILVVPTSVQAPNHVFRFSGTIGQTNQRIDYNVLSITEKTIQGTYESIDPYDRGVFTLQKGMNPPRQDTDNAKDCTLI